MATYLITGTSRGLGLELVKQILENQTGSKVIATARKPQESKELVLLQEKFPSNLSLVTMDVSSTESVKNAAEQVSGSHPNGIDYIFNNAGVHCAKNSDPDEMIQVCNTNLAGPFRVHQAFLPLINKSKVKMVVQVTSFLGSIAMQEASHEFLQANPGSDFYSYRVSKAALNSLTAMLAITHRGDGITFIAMHPGLVETDMYKKLDFKTPTEPAMSTEQSVKAMLETVHKLTFADSGKFIRWDGRVIPW
eukprot:Phypoly_transcript_16772.p1 GENE.Phypoly_transcript_16772~~Phypoly_transcript_16772.p1  ORF type:complete len:249 (+),score=29.38 Phypoly_transcript_16772:53-799(+)